MDMAPQERDDSDVDLVTAAYDWCWQQSRARYNRWVNGPLHPLARRFYLVVNAAERYLDGGVGALLRDVRFSLAETADAFSSFGFDAHAHAVRALNELVDDRLLSRDPRERDRQLLNEVILSSAEIRRLDRLFPSDETEVWRRLAAVVREHPEAFASSHARPDP